jgi:hypothetical protein
MGRWQPSSTRGDKDIALQARSGVQNGDDFGMRVRAAQERHVQHARKLYVVHITALASDQHRVFDAPH